VGSHRACRGGTALDAELADVRDDDGYDSVRGNWVEDLSDFLGVNRPPPGVMVLIIGGLGFFALEVLIGAEKSGFGYVMGGILLIRGLASWKLGDGSSSRPWLLPALIVATAAIAFGLLAGPAAGVLGGVVAAAFQWWQYRRRTTR